MRCVYLIRNTVNEKVYVGQTKNFVVRKAVHLYAARKGCERPLYRAIRKYGEDAFVFEILEECDDSLINDREQYWISQYDSFNREKGYNLTSGGNQNYVLSEETKQKLHDLNIGEKNPCYGRCGIKHPMFGKTNSKTSEMFKIWHKQGRFNGRKYWVGRKHTDETKQKIGQANSIHQKGEGNSQFGTTWIVNDELKISRKIPKEELDHWLEKGWRKGRK